MLRLLVYSLAFGFISCSGQVKVVSDGCPLKLSSAPVKDYQIHKRVWGSENDVVSIKRILEEEKIDCTKLRKVALKVGQTSGDIFASLVPFQNRMSVWLNTYE